MYVFFSFDCRVMSSMDNVDPRHLVSPPPGFPERSVPPPPGFKALGERPQAEAPPADNLPDLPVKGMTFTDWPEVEAFVERFSSARHIILWRRDSKKPEAMNKILKSSSHIALTMPYAYVTWASSHHGDYKAKKKTGDRDTRTQR